MKINLNKIGLLVSALVLAGSGLMAGVARADAPAKSTAISIETPTQVPGSVLPAGTYMFKNSGSRSGWNVVQIYNHDGSALVTTVLAYPNPKVAANGQTVIIYPANGAGTIPTMEGVVLAGESTVEQLAYPRGTADQIGAANHLRIPTTGTDDVYPSALPEAANSWSAPVADNSVSDANANTNSDSNAGSNRGANAQPIMTAQNVPETQEHELPKTASPLPLIMLIGLIAIVGIVILRRANRGKAL